MTQPLPADPIFAAIEAHRDAHLARAAVRYLPIHRETKKAPDVPGLQVVSNKGEWPSRLLKKLGRLTDIGARI